MADEQRKPPVPRLVLLDGCGARTVQWAGTVRPGEPFDYPDVEGAAYLVAGRPQMFRYADKTKGASETSSKGGK